MGVTRVLAVALTAQRTTDTVKEAIPLVPPPVAKSIFVTVLCVGLTAIFEKDWRKVVVEAGAAAAVASLSHDLQAGVQRYTDNQIMQVMQRQPRSTRPLGG